MMDTTLCEPVPPAHTQKNTKTRTPFPPSGPLAGNNHDDDDSNDVDDKGLLFPLFIFLFLPLIIINIFFSLLNFPHTPLHL